MAAKTFDCDVLVVGLGPVGAVLAALLAKAGVSTIAIDKNTAVYPLPRAVHFDHEIMRLFQQLGIAQAVGRGAIPLPRYEFRAADGQLLLSFDPVANAACGWASGYMFHQPSLENALRDLLGATKMADVRLGWSFQGLSQCMEGVTAQVEGPRGAGKIHARYLVGCDGGSSAVRAAIGCGLFDFEFDEPWLVIDAKVGSQAKLPTVNLQICDPARPITCVPAGPGRHRWEFMLLPGETAEQALEDEFIQSLLKPWDCEALEVERRAVYRFHGLVANRWRDGRVLLAGDSAHQMPPFAGQGLCSGLRDAANLAWKLQSVILGSASEALLNTYQLEREPHVRALVKLAIGMGQVVCTLDHQEAAARDQNLLARRAAGAPGLVAPQPSPYALGCVLKGSAGAGELFPQPVHDDGGQPRRLDDILGAGPWVISRRAAVQTVPGLCVHQLDAEELAPYRDALAAWLDKRSAQAVLVRPDRYVFATGSPEMLAAEWERALSGAEPSDEAPSNLVAFPG